MIHYRHIFEREGLQKRSLSNINTCMINILGFLSQVLVIYDSLLCDGASGSSRNVKSKFSPVDGDDQSEADREEESGLHGDCEAVACSPCGLCEADGLGVAA